MKQDVLSEILKIEGINIKGFGIIPKAVMHDTELSITSKTIYSYFCSFAGNGTTAFPGRDTILHHLCITKDNYYKNFKTLVSLGYISVEKAKLFPYKNTYILNPNPKKYTELKNINNHQESQLKFTGLKSQGYGLIPKLVMQDGRLDVKAKGIYSYFCSYSGSGSVAFPKVSDTIFHLNIGKQAYYKYLNQLIACNYITVVQRKEANGKFAINDYYINENPDESRVDIKPCTDLQDSERSAANVEFSPCADLPDIEKPDAENPYIEEPDVEQPYVEKQDTIINKRNKNNLTRNSNHNQSINSPQDGLIEEISTDAQVKENVHQLVMKNIAYDILKEDRDSVVSVSSDLLEDLFNVMVDVLSSSKRTIRIGGEERSAAEVKRVFMKINDSHIRYVINAYETNNTVIKNVKQYLITSLYNSTMTMDSFYTNLVRQN